MRCGISTACFYPQNTLEALGSVISTGAPVTELFLNTFSELEQSFVDKLAQKVKESGIEVCALHPFSSAMEGFFFVSAYEGRFQDGMEIYRRYFEVCAQLGCTKLVFHGDHQKNTAQVAMAEYVGRVQQITTLAKAYGVTLCHENVAYCRLGSVESITQYKQLMGPKAAFVLDTKQARRLQQNLPQMLKAMGGGVRHLHISDYSPQCDCIPPGAGQVEWPKLMDSLRQQNYEGDIIIELYREGFSEAQQLVNSMKYIATLL